jgi:hypothetical protein
LYEITRSSLIEQQGAEIDWFCDFLPQTQAHWLTWNAAAVSF